MRGEKKGSAAGSGPAKGSPPRARGKVHSSFGFCGAVGITPACAGKSLPIKACACAREDHPRVRGEKARGLL